jgi:phosphatidylglycerol:prolipoprotein diacylglycerol transferase
MMPILGRYGPFFLTGYFVALATGVALALITTAVPGRRLRRSGWLDGVLAGGVAGVLAGRLVFVLLNGSYFAENPGQAWFIWHGGLNMQAALLGGLATAVLWWRFTQRPVAPFLDLIAPGLAILFAAGWAACWFEGCAYGREAAPGILTAPLPDDFGVVAVRYQTQLAGVALSAVVAVLTGWWLWRRPSGARRPALLFLVTLGLLVGGHALVSLFRGDPAPIWWGVRADVVVDVLLVAVLLLLIAALLRSPPRADGEDATRTKHFQ